MNRTGTTGTEALRRERAARVRRLSFRVADGDVCTSTSDRTVIGTHESADIVLRDPSVSRFHCEVVLEDGRALLRDLGSLNGTIVDGTSVLAAHLRDGALVEIGRTRIHVESSSEDVEIPLS